MPYISIEDAKAGKFITILDDVELTLLQINYIAQIHDALMKADPPVDKPMALAIARFRDAYEIKDGEWVVKKKGNMSAILDAIAFEAGLEPESLAYASDWRVQSVTFDSQKYQLQDALDWLNKRGYRIVIDGNSDNKTMTFNQFEKSLCSASSKKQNAGDGIDLFVCKLKSEGVAKVENKTTQSYKPDFIALSVAVASKESEGNKIPNQIILHEGEWRDGKLKITGTVLDEMAANFAELMGSQSAYLRPYVKADHTESVKDIIGYWENVRVENVNIPMPGGKSVAVRALVGDEVITEPEALGKIQRGTWTRRSAEFLKPGQYKDSVAKKDYGYVLLGSAYVDVPQLTSIMPAKLPIAAAAENFEDAVVALSAAWDEINKKEGGDNMTKEELKKALEKIEDKELRLKMEGVIKEMEKKAGDAEKLAAGVDDKVKAAVAEKDAEIEKLRKQINPPKKEDDPLVKMRQELEADYTAKLAVEHGKVKKMELDKMAGVLAEKSAKGNALPQPVIDKAKVLLTSLYENEGKVMLRAGDKDEEFSMVDALQGLLIELRDAGLVNLTKLTSGEKPETKSNADAMLASAKAQGIPMVETVTG